ncbi:MAG: Asp-tRNA(Asn)/Glu-tRNA(Gln) amidotransferase subunit GatC [archaeon]|nr:Asp-tRNA(Asn)/Glu-tRNA(Gln) amidotransferase subunit GatC [archaeon]
MEEKVSRELLQKVAKNCRLKLSEAEIQKLLPQFSEMLETFRKISELDVEGIEPALHPVEMKNVFREDKAGECLTQDKALSNTVHKKNGYFKAPRVVV